MTELILQAKPFVRMAAPTARRICDGFLKVRDAFAAERLRNAMPVQARQARPTRVVAGTQATPSPRAA